MAELENDLELDKAVVFAIVAAHGDGIDTKSPDYLMEKWRFVQGCESRMEVISILDVYGQRIFYRWRGNWFRKPHPMTGTSGFDPSVEPTEHEPAVVNCQIHGNSWCYLQEDGAHGGVGMCNCPSYPIVDCIIDLHRLAAIERATTGQRTIGAGLNEPFQLGDSPDARD